MVNTVTKSVKKFKPKWYWYVGGGIGAFVIYFEYKKRSSANAAATATTVDPTSTDTTDSSYGSDYYDDSAGGYSQIPSSYGYSYNPSLVGTGTSSTVTAPTTNAGWLQQSEQWLVSLGYDPTAVTSALGKYLANASLSNDELGIVQAALGGQGQPPQSAPTPHVAPPAAPAAATYPDGLYRNTITGSTDLIQGNKRYHVSTPAKVKALGLKVQNMLPTWGGFTLPLAGSI